VLVILCATEHACVARALFLNSTVAMGLTSYSTYLWHQPLLAFARIRSVEEPPISIMPGFSVLARVLAAFSWRFVAQHDAA